LQARKRVLDCLEQQAADTAQLLDACAHAHAAQTPHQQATLQRAAAQAHSIVQSLSACRLALSSELASAHLLLIVPVAASPPLAAHNSIPAQAATAPHHAVSLCWASRSSWDALLSSRYALHDLATEAAAAAASPADLGGEEWGAPGVPGMADLAAQLHAAAAQAATWEAHVMGPKPSAFLDARDPSANAPITIVTSPAAITAAAPLSGAATTEASAFSRDLEFTVKCVLLWAQGLEKAAKAAPHETPAGDEAAAVAAAAAGGDAAAAVSGTLSRFTSYYYCCTHDCVLYNGCYKVAPLLCVKDSNAGN